MKVQVVTTFSSDGYRCYGKRFIDSFLAHCPGVPLIAYHESMDLDGCSKAVDWRNLDVDPDRQRFLAEHGSDPEKIGTSADFNSQAIRFCHKTFAVTSAFRQATDWLVWMDSDVVVAATPDWRECLPENRDLSYLGRDPALNPRWIFGNKWRPICSETGFVGYRVREPKVRSMLLDMRSYYTSGEIFTRPKTDWHDAKCFDLCRERSGIDPSRWHNLSQGLAGTEVWTRTVLGKWSAHHKGERRKRAAYGGIVG